MTIIIITHRLSFLKQSNKIFVIEKGKIIDSGNYKDLINQKNSIINKLIEDCSDKKFQSFSPDKFTELASLILSIENIIHPSYHQIYLLIFFS